MKKVLFVDDEQQILKSLTRLFADSEYQIFTAESGELALKLLENEKIDLIISDMRMPGMDGNALLSTVRRKHPEVMRIMLCGFADEKQVFDALKKNTAKLYIIKPWENDRLIRLVQQVFETEEILNNSHLKLLINNVEQLPTISISYQRIVEMIENDCDIIAISHEIERDQAIASKILHVANSAYFGIKTGSIRQAVTYIGLQNTRNLVLSTSILDAMVGREHGKERYEKLWEHAFLTSRILQFLYERHLGRKIPEAASAAGLLHNIGMVFLMQFFLDEYGNIWEGLREDYIDTVEAEKEVFGITHMEIGGYLLRWWELPYPIVEAAMYHHIPLNDKIVNHELVCAVHIASKYAHDMLGDDPFVIFDSLAFEALDIRQDVFEESLKGGKL